jgi:peptidoglycan hydrolase-like protein with peptidoglycan-binding domain
MPVETPTVTTALEQPPPIAPAPTSVVQDSAANTNDKNRTLDTRDIREIQTLLQALGMTPGPVDGVAGPLTTAAISRYEEARGQPTATGLNRELLARLRRDAGAATPSPAKAPTATRPSRDR